MFRKANTKICITIIVLRFFVLSLPKIFNTMDTMMQTDTSIFVFEDGTAKERGDTPEQIKESLTEGFKGLKLLKEGKVQARPIEELLNELLD